VPVHDDEVCREEDPFVRDPEDGVAQSVPPAERQRLRAPGRAAEVAVVVELLHGMVELEVRQLGPRDLRERRAVEVLERRRLQLGEPRLRPLAHQIRRPARGDDVRIERAGAVDVIAVPVAEDDRVRRSMLLCRLAQRTPGGERDVRVEDERLAAEVDEPGVADRDVALLRDRREDTGCELLDPQAVRRSRASCSLRRMIGFASLTISSRYTM